MLTEGMEVSADVLKVAHHGSRYSSSATFLDQVQANVAVISVGADNTYGHPTEETLARLQGAGARIFRTDQDGTVTITSDGHTIQYGGVDYVTFLPLVMNNPSSGVTPEPPPMPGVNQVCSQIGNAQMCGSVSSVTPAQYTDVTVYGRLLVNGEGQAGQTMTAAWHYKSTTSTCNGITDGDGLAECIRSIGRASQGYQVNVDVEIDGYTVTTWFTPQ